MEPSLILGLHHSREFECVERRQAAMPSTRFLRSMQFRNAGGSQGHLAARRLGSAQPDRGSLAYIAYFANQHALALE
jgi:hypothetical protein